MRKNRLNTYTPQIGKVRSAVDTARNRILIASIFCSLSFMAVAYQLVHVMCFENGGDQYACKRQGQSPLHVGRADIVDRNGVILATSIKTYSLYANPKTLMEHKKASQELAKIFPKLKKADLKKKLNSGKSFVWIARHLTPQQKGQVLALGIPGLDFIRDQRRVYPYGNLAAHVIGIEDPDGNGIAGLEKHLDEQLRSDPTAATVSIDIRLQHILRDELSKGVQEFQADAANGIVLDINTGEILAMASLPDFDPNNPDTKDKFAMFNRNTLGVYEMGSTMKVINTAMALESGKVTIDKKYDATKPIKIGRFRVTDYKGKNRWLDVEEIFIYSSNIGSAKMMLDAGIKTQQDFMDKVGFLKPLNLELPEIGRPIAPQKWREANAITISYGYGLSMTPLQLASAIGGVTNKDGLHVKPTLLKRNPADVTGSKLVSPKTAETVRKLMRRGVVEGTSRKAGVPGIYIAGKTGTANQRRANGKGYQKKDVNTCFVGVFPEVPRYVVLVNIENPARLKKTFGFNAGGWNAAPVGGRIISRIAPVLGVLPNIEETMKDDLPALRFAALAR